MTRERSVTFCCVLYTNPMSALPPVSDWKPVFGESRPNVLAFVADDWVHVSADTPWLKRSAHGWYFAWLDQLSMLHEHANDINFRDILVWRSDPDRPSTRSCCAVYARFDGTVIVEMRTPKVGPQDWVAIAGDVRAVVGDVRARRAWARSFEDRCVTGAESTQTAFYEILFERELHMDVALNDLVRAYFVARDLQCLRYRRACRVVDDTVTANLSSIKARLWRPGGPLVTRMLADHMGGG